MHLSGPQEPIKCVARFEKCFRVRNRLILEKYCFSISLATDGERERDR